MKRKLLTWMRKADQLSILHGHCSLMLPHLVSCLAGIISRHSMDCSQQDIASQLLLWTAQLLIAIFISCSFSLKSKAFRAASCGREPRLPE